MPACRKTDHCDPGLVQMPLIRMFLNACHSLLIILQRQRPLSLGRAGIAENEGLVSCFQIRHCHRIGFTIRAHGITAAGDDQHGGPPGKAILAVHFLDISSQRNVSIIIQKDLLCLHFAISLQSNPRPSFNTSPLTPRIIQSAQFTPSTTVEKAALEPQRQ